LQKALIIFLLTLNLACSVERMGSKQEPIYAKNNIESLVKNTIKNNITDDDFFIEKGEISIESKNETKRFIFSVKHKNTDTYLISIKNSIGLEGARIFLSVDSVLINDRMNKRLLYGRINSIENITGLPLIYLKMVFGDIIIGSDSSARKTDLVNNRIVVSQYISGIVSKSVINPRICKMNMVECVKNSGNGTILFKYSKFNKKGKHFPSSIEIVNERESENVRIRIGKVQLPWYGEIEFFPGNGYKKEEIK
jgi:hypothetical protein